MGYDRSDSFPFDIEPNGNPFGSKWKGKLSLRSYPIQCERKWKYKFSQCIIWQKMKIYNKQFLKLSRTVSK